MPALKTLSVAAAWIVTSLSLSRYPWVVTADPVPQLLMAPFSTEEARARQREWSEHLRTAEIVENSIGMLLVLIPPGEFLMGSPASEEGARYDERQHRVRLTQPYYVGMYEVTQMEWKTLMGSNFSLFAPTGRRRDRVTGIDTSRFPVESVTWYDCIEFCNALSRHEDLAEFYRISDVTGMGGNIVRARITIVGGNGYRLLTEAEWEYACRAGTTTPFHFGTDSNGSESNINGNFPLGTETTGPYLDRTTRRGSYSPNQFGLYDMHGNVREWCWDAYDAEAYKDRSGTIIDPIVNSPTDGRVLRGGCWSDYASLARSAHRGWITPNFRNSRNGFRIARTP